MLSNKNSLTPSAVVPFFAVLTEVTSLFKGLHVRDRMNVIYTDISIRFDNNFDGLSRYADEIRNAVSQALEEETILVATFKVFHSE